MSYTKNLIERVYIRSRTSNGPNVNDTSQYRTLSGTKSGSKVEKWREKVRNGQQAGSPYTLDMTKIEFGKEADFSWEFAQPWVGGGRLTPSVSGYRYHQLVDVAPAHLSITESNVDSAALSKTYAKLQKEFQHLNSPAVIAEFLDVIRQFGSPASALVDLTNRRLNRLQLEARGLSGSVSFKRVKWLEILASTWLEYSFGLAPLISDTRDAAEALARWQLENELPQLRAKTQSKVQSELAVTSIGAPQLSPINSAQQNGSSSVKKTVLGVQYTCGLQGELLAAYGSNERLLQLLGFDHGNWIPALWEAVPWSWLVDYFTNVQQILEAAVTNTSRVSWIVKTVKRQTTVDYGGSIDIAAMIKAYAGSQYKPVGSYRGHTGLGNLRVIRTTMSRTLPASLGVPPLVVEHPFDSAKRIANMVSVLFARRGQGNSQLWLF